SGVALQEQVEHSREKFGRDTLRAVLNVALRVAPYSLHNDLDRPARRRILQRVFNQVNRDLFDSDGISIDPDRLDLDLEGVSLHLPGAAQSGEAAAGGFAEVDGVSGGVYFSRP